MKYIKDSLILTVILNSDQGPGRQHFYSLFVGSIKNGKNSLSNNQKSLAKHFMALVPVTTIHSSELEKCRRILICNNILQ